MSLRSSCALLTRVLLLVSFLSTAYLYLYPVWSGCAFPSTTGPISHGFQDTLSQHTYISEVNYTRLAPFRLLVLADPQLEGDSSLPDPEDAFVARLRAHWEDLRKSDLSGLVTAVPKALRDIVLEDIPEALRAVRKTIDLFGNDYYLAHIYRTLHWWIKPTHVTVLGDLIGSQWVSDDEFAWRGWRYWNRVLAGSQPVEEAYMSMHKKEQDEQQIVVLDPQISDWSRQVINIAGNHDIGYAGDISELRTSRFQRVFGELNWDIRFQYPPALIPETHRDRPIPSIQLIVLNSMLLDTPALNSTLQTETYEYVNNLIMHRLSKVEVPDRNASFTLLLTHVPLHKPSGVCVDAPFFDFWDHTDEGEGEYVEGGLKEQNHLSQQVSEHGILQSLFGMSGNLDAVMAGVGRRGLILNGHDHEGCDVVHFIERYNYTPEVIVEAVSNGEATLDSVTDGPRSDDTFTLKDNQSAIPSASMAEELYKEQDPSDGTQSEATSLSDSTKSSDSPTESLTSASFIASTEPSSPTPTWRWQSIRTSQYPPRDPPPLDTQDTIADLNIALREVTLRSMMGSYGGNAGLLSVWYDFSHEIWEYDITMCKAGVQHIWWAVHILDLITICVILLLCGEQFYKPKQKATTERMRAISYVRERPNRPNVANGISGKVIKGKQAKGVEETKRVEVVQTGRNPSGGETEKRRVYKHVLR